MLWNVNSQVFFAEHCSDLTECSRRRCGYRQSDSDPTDVRSTEESSPIDDWTSPINVSFVTLCAFLRHLDCSRCSWNLRIHHLLCVLLLCQHRNLLQVRSVSLLFLLSSTLLYFALYYSLFRYVRPLRQEERERLERELIEADKAGFAIRYAFCLLPDKLFAIWTVMVKMIRKRFVSQPTALRYF